MSEADTSHGPDATAQSPRVIGGLGAFAIVAGSMLGIGIFLAPSEVANYISGESTFLAVWLVAGVFAFAGAVAFAELGALLPRAGGDYVFQSEAFGPSVAFASGWVLFGAIFTGSIATMSVAICQYQLPALTGWDTSQPVLGPITGAQLGAVGLVMALTTLNSVGTKLSAGTQTLLTLVPLSVLAVLAVFIIGTQPTPVSTLLAEFAAEIGPRAPAAAPEESSVLTAIVMAYMAVYFAYSGWNSVIYVAGEVKAPGRNLPRALVTGTATVTVLYVVMCIAFLQVLGIEGVHNAGEVGTASAAALEGSAGTTFITILIAMALLAGLNGTVLGGARVAYAMGKGGAFWSGVAKLSPRSKVPMRALWLQAAWSVVIILSGKFTEIYNMTTLAMIITGTLTVASLFVLRRKMADAHRPYKATGYPWLPGLYLVSSIIVIAVMVSRAFSDKPDAWYPLLGVAILGVAFATHRLWFRHRQQAVAMIALAVVGGGLLIARGARAVPPEAAPAAQAAPASAAGAKVAPSADHAALAASALAAKDSEESKALRDLYAVLTCAHRKPVIAVNDYEAHCKRFAGLHATYDEKVKSKAEPWIAQRRPKGLPRTVFYPFSGADLVSSVLAFPDALLHVHLSLEHGGPVDALLPLNADQRFQALSAVLDASEGLLTLSDSKTRDLRLAHEELLPGKLPIALAGLYAHGAEVVAIRYFKIGPDGKLEYYAHEEMAGDRTRTGHRTKMDARWSNFELAFRLPGSPEVRLLQHAAVNLHNSHLGKPENKGVRAWLEGLGEVAFMTKAATYLLWSPGFSRIRDLIIAQAAWMLSDASGIPPRYLDDKVWEVKPYGSFTCDLLKWREKGGHWKKVNDEMARFFRKHSPGALDFRFGYVDCLNRASLMTATRRAR